MPPSGRPTAGQLQEEPTAASKPRLVEEPDLLKELNAKYAAKRAEQSRRRKEEDQRLKEEQHRRRKEVDQRLKEEEAEERESLLRQLSH